MEGGPIEHSIVRAGFTVASVGTVMLDVLIWWGCSRRTDPNTLAKSCRMRSTQRVLRSLSGYVHVFASC